MNKNSIINQAQKISIHLNTKKTAFFALFFICLVVLTLHNDNNGFGKGHHGFLSSHGASLAKNLSPDSLFLMFSSKWTDDLKQTVSYQAYNRFPVSSFLILKLAISIFKDDLSMQVSICRQVMNLFFLGCLLFCFLSVFELSKNYLAALIVTFLCASSAYLNYYNDMIFNDIPTLFGFMLAGHGFILYELYGKKLQMFIKTIIGLSFGWQVYAIIIAFILFYISRTLIKNRSLILTVKNNVILLGFVSLLFGVTLLSYNLAVESFVTGKPISKLSTIRSAEDRLGKSDEFNTRYAEHLAWDTFIKDQMHRIAGMTIPYYFAKGKKLNVLGITILIFVIAGIFFSKPKILLLMFIFSGFIWSFPMKSFAFSHDFQSIYYIGIPLSFYFILLRPIQNRLPGLLPVISACSILLFIHTSITFNISKAKNSGSANQIINDFQNIIDITGTDNIYHIDGDIHGIVEGYHTAEFCLAGNFFTNNRNAEYIVSRNRHYNASLLTPANNHIFLFRGSPHFPNAYNRRGLDHMKIGNYYAAVADFNKAIEKQADFVDAFIHRGIAHKRLYQYDNVLKDLSKALELSPCNVKALNSLAWFHATCPESNYRDGKKAVRLSKKALDINHNPVYMDTLAAAYAETGDFHKAISTQEDAIRFLRGKIKPSTLSQLTNHLDKYKAHQPWRE